MVIISQLQEQVNTIVALAFNTFGSLQRDAPPVRLSPKYPKPPANPTEDLGLGLGAWGLRLEAWASGFGGSKIQGQSIIVNIHHWDQAG
ncbi:hypothetical protein QQP08_023195 [Theobroma cacao]|nr:hypothetical protein QQP08_023195 [Theobroma cacao]